MTSSCRIAPLLMVGCTVTPLAQAATGGVDSFYASATQVMVGDTVDFTVLFSLSTSSWSGGGSNPFEPPPQEGYQEWYVNWYSWESETLRNVWLHAGGQSFADYPSLGPGGGYSNAWSFSITFTEPGRFDIDLSGGWQAEVQSGYSSESASRNCYYFDPDAGGDLFCDSWYWQYSDANDWYTVDGSLSAGPIGIEVAALPVPEPGTYALILAGLAGVGLVARRRKT